MNCNFLERKGPLHEDGAQEQSYSLDESRFMEPVFEQNGTTRLESNELHAHSHVRMRVGHDASSREDFPFISYSDIDDSPWRQGIGSVKKAAIGSQIARVGRHSSAGCGFRQFSRRKECVTRRSTAFGSHLGSS